ncbi:MAG: hypothetical protein JW736_00430 [Deltaproteobacteria bacterium]|nr:hypothetical protein [Deltaproteobacteria bacterium]
MDTVRDFEDILDQFAKHGVRYLIIGGLAFIFHAKPRFTKDMDLWIGPEKDNLNRANEALAEFGSPFLLDPSKPEEILQLGMAPNRIDLLISVPGVDFNASWEKKIESRYGEAPAYFVDLDTLIQIKSPIDDPRHREDVRVLRKVKELLAKTRK